MFDSKLRLQGVTLHEILHEGLMGNNLEVSIDDWRYIETLFSDFMSREQVEDEISYRIEDTAEENYLQGLYDGGGDVREIARLQKLLEDNGIEY